MLSVLTFHICHHNAVILLVHGACVCLVQNLYDMLLKLLEERGIDGDFVDQMTEFSTSYEHNKYVDTLEQLRDFVSAKQMKLMTDVCVKLLIANHVNCTVHVVQ